MTQPPSSVADIFFNAVVLQSAGERAAYLDSACGTDSALRKRVERLLSADNRADDFLEYPAIRPVDTVTAVCTECPGTLIGPYKLLQQIGEGGMGTVYMAEQELPVRRRVALKVIKPGMDSGLVIARFEAERQALALMDHVNIARVLDAGTTQQGRPYFVMELVNGVSITRYCDDNRLTPRQRLELFVPVCQAIQHAHQKGIIHRDIKPTNVMVTLYDGKPVPKVIDFGVAKATEQKLTERTLFTQYGTMVGTLEYMSPEQAEMSALGVDTRSDIYSLGVLLYELLTSSTPLTREQVRGAAYAEVLRRIKEEEPPKPSTRLSESGKSLASISAQRQMEPAQLTSLMRGELDWIVMKTLEKDRSRRYETANGLAADVNRYLNDEPVEACPPSPAYRLRKFVRRNRLAMISAALVGVAISLGIAGSVWQAIRATKAQSQAQANFQAAELQRKRAEHHFRSARDAVNHMTEVALERLSLLPRTEQVRQEMLGKALEFYQTFTEDESNNPTVRQEMGKAYMRVGWIDRDFGRTQSSIDSYQQAIGIFKDLMAEFPDEPEYRNDFALSQAAYALLIAHRLPEAKLSLTLAIEIQRQLVAELPGQKRYKTDLVRSLHHYAWVLMYNPIAPDFEEAEKVLLQIQAIQAELEPSDQKPGDYTDALMGDVLQNTGRPEEAEQVWRRSLANYQKLLLDAPLNPVYRSEAAHRHENLGGLLERDGRLEEAEQSYREAISIREKLVVDFPDAVQEGLVYRTVSALSELLRRAGRVEEAFEIFEQTLSQRQTVLGPEHPRTVALMNSQAWAIAVSGHAETRHYQRAVQLAEKAVELAPQIQTYRNTLGVAHYRAGDWDAAITDFEKSMTLGHGGDAYDWFFLAMAHWQLGHQDRARQYYQQAVEWMEKNRPKDKELGRFRREAAALLGIAENVLPPQIPP